MATRHSKFKQSDAQAKIEKSLKIATDLAFLYLQELDEKNASSFNTGTLSTGGILFFPRSVKRNRFAPEQPIFWYAVFFINVFVFNFKVLTRRNHRALESCSKQMAGEK
jgi:hypothetical protein